MTNLNIPTNSDGEREDLDLSQPQTLDTTLSPGYTGINRDGEREYVDTSKRPTLNRTVLRGFTATNQDGEREYVDINDRSKLNRALALLGFIMENDECKIEDVNPGKPPM